ncbi:hypothetical protein [Lactiplantibacillus plajomi]|uniref:Lipoprotein n=1 Tax=Lactiplantibacillus plajomi TaxID=1457217 RepID=A0ABV6K0M2_9LACO|nr:hypothetical protein [Lactiplantibacillus plajomi]
MRRFTLLGFGALLLLSGCASPAATGVSTTQQKRITAAAQSASSQASAKAQDASASRQTGKQYQATDDHITSATKAAAAVQQVLGAPRDQQFSAVPSVNVDGRGHHYYQVNAFKVTADQQRGPLLQRYFVYLDGKIVTKQLD